MHRSIVYDGELGQTIDFLNANKFSLQGQAFAMAAILGNNTVVVGLVCAPTAPTATLNVTVGAGSIYALDQMDASPYGDLGVDTHVVVKQGILTDPVTLTLTPPSTAGYNQIYLIEAILNDTDSGSAVVPYFNAQNITQPFSGPGNTGAAQFTTRLVNCVIALKAGAAAPAGTEVAPTPDAGYTALYTIDLPNGTTQITGGMIITIPAAPFFPTLPSIPGGVQTSAWTFGADTGAVNAMVLTQWPPVTILKPGQIAFVKAAFGNTGAATFALGSTGAQPIHRANGASLSSGDYNANMIVGLMWDGSAWQMLNFSGYSAGTTNNNTYILGIPYAVDSGTPNNVIGNFSPAVTSLAAGLTVEVQIGALNTNTGASTLQCNALAAKPIIRNGLPLQLRDLLANMVCLFVYDGTSFELINARWPFISFDAGASPPSSDVVLAVGDQLTITWTGMTQIPMHVACGQGLYQCDMVVTANATIETDFFLQPNNTHYGANDVTGASITLGAPDGQGTGVPPYLWGYPAGQPTADVWGVPGAPAWNEAGVFSFDLWSDQGSGSNVPDPNPAGFNSGPLMMSLLISTFTSCKTVMANTAIKGGPGLSSGFWLTTVPWTSLGTFGFGYGPATSQSFSLTKFYSTSGAMSIRRLL